MSDKPAGEWTVHQWKDRESYDVKCGENLICGDLLLFEANSLVNAHNAALDAEREKLADRHKLCVDYEMKWKAEQEKSRILGNMIDGVSGQPGFREQLAAEQEKVRKLRALADAAGCTDIEK